jgi:NAD+ synthase
MMILDELTTAVTDATKEAIVRFICAEAHKAGRNRVVLGLSGGIDSALACYLAVEALGAENVLALLLPYRTSNPSSEADARLVIEDLRIPYQKAPITPMADAFFALSPGIDARRQGNVFARLRMIAFYDRSEEWRGLVLGTSNRAEMLLGYFTLHGDGAAALRPLVNLYKCQIRKLAQMVGVPEPILIKPPSADLWADQTDEGELGFSYDDADQVLHLSQDRHWSPERIAEAGFAPDLVRRILDRVAKTEFKRTNPPAPALSFPWGGQC